MPLTPVSDALIGSACGVLEVLMMQPAVYWKAELQQQRFSFARAIDPRFVYRGLFISCLSIAPVTAVQFCVNGLCLRACRALRQDGAVPQSCAMLAGVVAGATSAIIMSPSQLIEINQQKHGGTFLAISRRVLQEHGFPGLYRGYALTATREGIFTCSYLAAAPLLQDWLHHQRPESSPVSTALASSLLAGAVGAALTHPPDTLKTRIQGDMFPVAPGASAVSTNISTAVAELRRKGHLAPQLYAGFTPRMFRIICCTFIYGRLRNLFEPFGHSMT